MFWVSRFFTPIHLTPYHLTTIYSPLYHLDTSIFYNHLTMPQRPVGIDMKLSQPNVGLIYPLNYDKTCL